MGVGAVRSVACDIGNTPEAGAYFTIMVECGQPPPYDQTTASGNANGTTTYRGTSITFGSQTCDPATVPSAPCPGGAACVISDVAYSTDTSGRPIVSAWPNARVIHGTCAKEEPTGNAEPVDAAVIRPPASDAGSTDAGSTDAWATGGSGSSSSGGGGKTWPAKFDFAATAPTLNGGKGQVINIRVGDTVVWTNDELPSAPGGNSHSIVPCTTDCNNMSTNGASVFTATATPIAGSAAGVPFPPVTFATAGTYTYECGIHLSMMIGQVTVQ